MSNSTTDAKCASSSSGNVEHLEQLVKLLINVKLQGYKFTTVTPCTHHFFLSKNYQGKSLRDIFGWNLPFSIDALCPMLQRIMLDTGNLEKSSELMRSTLRISSLGGDLFFHSAFPTSEADAVFFGPDTYRFARFIRQSMEGNFGSFHETVGFKKPIRILDIGCGSGAGGIAAIRALPQGLPYVLTMNDINTKALELTVVNALVAEVPINLIVGDVFEIFNESFDIILANPPYMKDECGRAYRNGGENLGLDLSIRIFKKAFEHLAPGGLLILYTGVAMSTQVDPFLSTIKPLLAAANCSWSYEEIDPDVFGEELEMPAYSTAHRIAAVGLIVKRI